MIGSPKKGMKTNKLKTEVQMKENAAFWKNKRWKENAAAKINIKCFRGRID